MSDAELSLAAESAQDDSELGSTSQTYVVYRKDARRCMAPLCGGYWVHDVNRAVLREVYVSALDLSGVSFDEQTAGSVRWAPDGEVVLKGKLGPVEPRFSTRQFVVSAAWRGMPGMTVAAGQTYYRVAPVSIQCFAAPCPTMQATKLNATETALLTQLDVADAARPHVQRSWLEARIALRNALAAGAVVRRTSTVGPAPETVLDASQVFLKLPERAGPCPAMPIAQCPTGKVHSWARTADRCLIPTGCVTPRVCAAVTPTCDPAYHAVTWRGGTGACTQWACDPDFVQ